MHSWGSTRGTEHLYTHLYFPGLWEQENTMGDGDYSEIRRLQAPDEGLCDP